MSLHIARAPLEDHALEMELRKVVASYSHDLEIVTGLHEKKTKKS